VFQAVMTCRSLNLLFIEKQNSKSLELASMNFLNVIDHQITLQQKQSNRNFAIFLLEVTRVILQVDEPKIPSTLEEYKEQHIASLVKGNQYEANYFEMLITQLSLELEREDAWNKLEASGFTFNAIYNDIDIE